MVRAPSGVVGIDALGRWHFYALNFAIVRRVVRTGRAAEDFDRVVMTAHKPVRAEVRDLLAGMTGDVARKHCLKPTPFLTILSPRFDFLGDEAGIGIEEG